MCFYSLVVIIIESKAHRDPLAHTLAVLGTLPSPSTPLPAILRLERTSLPSDVPSQFSSGILASTMQTGGNDIASLSLLLRTKLSFTIPSTPGFLHGSTSAMTSPT